MLLEGHPTGHGIHSQNDSCSRLLPLPDLLLRDVSDLGQVLSHRNHLYLLPRGGFASALHERLRTQHRY